MLENALSLKIRVSRVGRRAWFLQTLFGGISPDYTEGAENVFFRGSAL